MSFLTKYVWHGWPKRGSQERVEQQTSEVRLDVGREVEERGPAGRAGASGPAGGQDLADLGQGRRRCGDTGMDGHDKDSGLRLPTGFRTSHSPFLEDSSPGCPHGSLPPLIQVSVQMPLCQRPSLHPSVGKGHYHPPQQGIHSTRAGAGSLCSPLPQELSVVLGTADTVQMHIC